MASCEKARPLASGAAVLIDAAVLELGTGDDAGAVAEIDDITGGWDWYVLDPIYAIAGEWQPPASASPGAPQAAD